MRARIIVSLLVLILLYVFWHLASRSEGFRDLLERRLEKQLGVPVKIGRCYAGVDLHLEAEDVLIGSTNAATGRLEAERLVYSWRPPWQVRRTPGPQWKVVLDGVRLHPGDGFDAGVWGFVLPVIRLVEEGAGAWGERWSYLERGESDLVLEIRRGTVSDVAQGRTFHGVNILWCPFSLGDHRAFYISAKVESAGKPRSAEILICDGHIYFFPPHSSSAIRPH